MRHLLLIGFSFVVVVLSARLVAASEICNQTDVPPGGNATVSVLLPDVATNLQPRLTARNAGAGKPVDPWGPCPIASPFGPCSPAAHADVETTGTRKVLDPDDGMQLVAFEMKNAAGAPARTVRLCVKYAE